MDIIYGSSFCESHLLDQIMRALGNNIGFQVQKFHSLLIKGLTTNGCRVHCVSKLPLNRSSSKAFYFPRGVKSDNLEIDYIPFLNIPLVSNAITTVFAFLYTLIKVVRSSKRQVIICDGLNISLSIGMLLVSKLMRIQSVAIVTDLPSYLFAQSKSLNTSINNVLLRGFDSYVVLTEEMIKKIDKTGRKKYIVIEGITDIDGESKTEVFKHNKNDKLVLLYAGSLNVQYGINMLVEAFVLAELPNTELHIYGRGDYEGQVSKLSRCHDNIVYWGGVKNDDVIIAEANADLLINPRLSKDTYTRYSFPSKLLEYMNSGSAVLTTKLPCIPEDYYEFLYFFDDESVVGMSKTLKQLTSMGRNELRMKGLKAQKYVAVNKNYIIQSERLIEFLSKGKRYNN